MLFFLGYTNIFIVIIINCFISVVFLCVNYKKVVNINFCLYKLVYIPIFIIVIILVMPTLLDYFICLSIMWDFYVLKVDPTKGFGYLKQ